MYHIIVNPEASSGRSRKALARAERYLREQGAEYLVHRTEYQGHARAIAGALAEAGETELIALGGDGTVHEVLNGPERLEGVRLGIVPAGTGNDFARFVGIPAATERALALILHSAPKPTDYISCAGVRSLNSIGTGMDVDVLERCRTSRAPGKLKYWSSLLHSLRTFRGNEFVACCGGEETEHEAFLAVLCNGGMFGGGIKICPEAVVDSGTLKLVIVDALSGLGKLRGVFALLRGKVLSLKVTTCLDVEEVEIRPKRPFLLQFDGELYGGIPFRAKVEKGGLQLYRP